MLGVDCLNITYLVFYQSNHILCSCNTIHRNDYLIALHICAMCLLLTFRVYLNKVISYLTKCNTESDSNYM